MSCRKNFHLEIAFELLLFALKPVGINQWVLNQLYSNLVRSWFNQNFNGDFMWIALMWIAHCLTAVFHHRANTRQYFTTARHPNNHLKLKNISKILSAAITSLLNN